MNTQAKYGMGSVVKGIVAGRFMVIGSRITSAGRIYDLVNVDSENNEIGKGQCHLLETSLVLA